MAEVLIRNLSDSVVQCLREQASSHGNSLEDELRAILTNAAQRDLSELRRKAVAIRNKTANRQKTNSLDLLREDRNR